MIQKNFHYFSDWLSNEPRQRLGIRALQIILGAVFIFRVFTELPFARYLYGVDGIGDDQQYELVYGSFIGGFLNGIFQLDLAVNFLLLALAICGICYIVEYRTRVITFVSLITFNMLASRNTALGDGGDNVTQIILIYMLLLIPLSKTFEEGSLKVWFHNLGVVAIGAQIMILYFTAGFMKISGDVWTSGIALFNVSQVEAFSLPVVREIFKNSYISTIATYITMIFLIWFPIAMFSRLRLVWIFMGISFHLGILGFMGLVTFGATMIGMELFFITDKEYRNLAIFVKDIVKISRIEHFWRVIRSKLSTNTGIASKKQI